ncbi:MAG: LacI family DNA-binding transcriptional regulator [Christensenella sp.]|nr:LacI family DNA-binding transcriptional regulator [Christensenella sp.]
MDKKSGHSSNKNLYIGIREIAALANVSTATVSRVINTPELCSPATRKKVEQIIKEYNYVPNESITRIFSKSSKTIAFFILDIENPFYTNLILELNDLCFKKRYTLLICATENDEKKEQAYLEFCLAKRCEGIIVTEGVSRNNFKNISIPIVTLDRQISPQTPCVTSEGYHSVRKSINYMYNLGHRKIGFIGPEDLCSIDIRFSGYTDELTEKGLDIKPEYIFRKKASPNPQLGKEALQYYLSISDAPTAVFCANDMIALGLINEATLMRISIPENLSVCGYDHVLSNYLYMPLTTIEQNIPKIASALFKALTQPSSNASLEIIDVNFIPGKTCSRLKDSKRI